MHTLLDTFMQYGTCASGTCYKVAWLNQLPTNSMTTWEQTKYDVLEYIRWYLTHQSLFTHHVTSYNLINTGTCNGVFPNSTTPLFKQILAYHQTGIMVFTRVNFKGNSPDICIIDMSSKIFSSMIQHHLSEANDLICDWQFLFFNMRRSH